MDVIRRQDPIDRLHALKEVQKEITPDDMIDALRQIPSIDAEEVVRCGNCVHYNLYYLDDGSCYGRFCDILRINLGRNFFCANGEWRYT